MPTFFTAVVALALGVSASVRAADKSFDREVPAEPKGIVEISNVAGAIEVTGWDRNAVSVHGQLGEGVERVDVTSQPGHTTIKVVLPDSGHHHPGDARLTVQIPQGSELDVAAVSADVTAMKVLGIQRLQSVSGRISAELAQADAEIKNVSGDITLHGHGQAAKLHLSTVSGDVKIEHAAGDLDVGTVSGTVKGLLDGTRSLRARSTSGDVTFTGKLAHGANVDVESISGELTLRASADGGFGYELTSFSGGIDNCFGAAAQRTSQFAPGRSLRGTHGDGGGRVHMKSLSGALMLCDK
ncbi:MAG: hypothetical protein PVS2B3_00780 [Steroidobacteraceae bacterium]